MASRVTRSNNGRKMSSASSATTRSKAATSKSQALTSRQDPPAPSGKRRTSLGKAQDVWCTCRQPDDGTPMIRCESCADWFHFSCIQLSERDAEDIQVYICDACHDKTQLSTVYEWEGPETIQNVRQALDGKNRDTKSVTSYRRTRSASEVPPDSPIDDDGDDEDDGVASGDDYEEGAEEEKKSWRKKGNRIASSDEDDKDSDDDELPHRSTRLKRKRSRKETQQRKRPRKSATPEVSDDDRAEKGFRRLKKRSPQPKDRGDSPLDATRKYCLTKLQEILTPMFLEFAKHTTDDDSTNEVPELTEDEKHAVEERALKYSRELERCLYDIYGEIDKNGHKAAVGKYKDRFRMLTFNLSQEDRYHLRKSIGTNSLPEIELAKMSSVDLANEKIKQRIEAANRESLQHSILTERPTLPRAKITHKGEEIIEDIEGFDIGKRFREEELLEREREREKASREKAAKAVSISPVSPVRPSFGPQDILAQQHTVASQMAAQALAEQTANLAQAHTAVDTPTEPSFKLDDLIAIDLPDSPNQGPTQLPATTEVSSVDEKTHKEPFAESQTQTEQEESMSPTAAFDLKNVWSGNESTPQESSGSPIASARPDDGNDLPNVDIDLGAATHDEDFDMFLAENEPPSATAPAAPVPSGPEREQSAFKGLPIVWNGNILMPDSEKCPKVQARQVGGRLIDSHSSQWSILFPTPSHQLRIEGRVPVNDSAKYITQNRLNVSRELVVVAFTPADERKEYDELLSILINRGRHAVIHPWGSRPGLDAPGKELYLVPIIPKQPLPDYVELLDLVQFPKQSDENRLLGVFILNKGKFSAPAYSQPLPPPLPSGLSLPPSVPSLLNNLSATLPPPIPSIPSAVPNVVNQNPPLNPDLISKLSAEQIESLLQTVLANNGSLPTSLPASAPAIPTTFAPPLPAPITSLLQSHQPLAHPPAPYPYSPTTQQGPSHPPPNSFTFGPRGDSTSERDKSASPYERHNDRSERGRGRGRGFEKKRDGGWAGRARGRGRGNNSGGGGPHAWS